MDTEMLIYYLVSLFGIFLLTAVIARFLIPKLKSLKVGQKILDIGPRWHKSKEGTPVMGGLTFIAATTVVYAAVIGVILATGAAYDIIPLSAVYGFALLNGLIGFVDDYTKLVKKQNQGLTASQKFLLQLVVAGLFLGVMTYLGYIDTEMHIPFTDIKIELGMFYYVVSLVILVGIANSGNLTDGVDGLASSVTFVVGGFFSLLAFQSGNMSLALVGASMTGGTLGFLVYNFYPAKVFMGDTGSLFLGGMAAGAAFLCGSPLIIAVAGIIYIIENLSVMLQVGYYKLTKKRIFKMAPIHHHFEMSGWSEVKIVGVFSAVTLAGCILAWFGVR